MTCIIGIEHEGEVWIGGDSSVTEQWNIRQAADPKVFAVDDKVLIGYCGSFRMGQLLQYGLTVPEQECDDDMAFLVARFLPAVGEVLGPSSLVIVEPGNEVTGQFLVGYRGKLYRVENNLQILRLRDGYDAIGFGAPYALGALRAHDHLSFHPSDRILFALKIAAHFCNGVCGPFEIVQLKEE